MSEAMFGGGRTVNYEFTADTSQYTASLGEAIATTQQYEKIATGAAGAVSKLGVAMTSATANVFGGNKSMMSPAIQQAAAYEQLLSGLSARTVAARQSFTGVGEAVRKMARDLPIGMTGAVQQFEALSKMGVTAGDSMAGIANQMAKLGAATGEMGPGLTAQMTQFQRVMGSLDPGAISKAGDALTGVTASMGASATGTLAFANQIAPLADLVGMTQTQVTGLSAAFERAGVDGGRGATVFTKVVSDMDKVVREGLPGVEVYANAVGKTNEEFKKMYETAPTEATIRFFEAIAGGGRGALRTLDSLGFSGARDQRSIAAIAAGGELRKSVSEAQRSYGSGVTEKAAEDAFSGLSDTVAKTNASLTQLVEASGRPLIGAFTALADKTNSVAGFMAGLVGSPVFQSLMVGGLIAKGAVGAGMAGASASWNMASLAGLPGATRANAGRALGWIGQYKNPLMFGGLAAAGTGMAMNNPMMSMLGMMAMGTAFAPGLAKMWKGAPAGLARATNFLFGSTFDSASRNWFGTRGNQGLIKDQVARQAALVSKMDPEGKGFRNAAGGSTAFVPAGVRNFNGDVGASRLATRKMESEAVRYAKSLEKIKEAHASGRIDADKYRKALDSTSSQALKRLQAAEKLGKEASLDPRRAARSAAGSYGRMLGGGISALGSGLVGLAGTPLGIVAGVGAVAGIGYAGWKQTQEVQEQAKDMSNNAMTDFGEKAGVATRTGEPVRGVDSLLGAVKGFDDALKVTSRELNAYGRQDRERVPLPHSVGEGDDAEMRTLTQWAEVITTGQSADYIEKVLLEIGASRGQDVANQVGRNLKARRAAGQTTMDNFWDLMPSDTDIGEQDWTTNPFARAWQNAWYLMGGDYGGREEAYGGAAAAGEGIAARAEQLRQTEGRMSAAQYRSDEVAKAIRGYFEKYPLGSPGAGDKDLVVRMLKGSGYTDSRAEEVGRLVQETFDRNRKEEGRGGVVPQSEIDSIIDNATREDSEIIEKWADKSDGILDRWAKSSDPINKQSAAILQYAKDKQLTTEQMIELAQTGETTTSTGDRLSLREAGLESLAGQTNILSRALPGQRTGELAGFARILSGEAGTSPLTTIKNVQDKLLSGDIQQESPRWNQLMGQLAAAQTAAPLQLNTLTTPEQAYVKIAQGREAYEKLGSYTSEDEAKAEMGDTEYVQAREAAAGYIEGGVELQNYANQLLEMERSFYRARTRAEEDYYRQREYTIEDYNRQREWQIEDHQLQLQYAEEDFYQQRGWQEDDFYKQRKWASEDYHRQRERETITFQKSMRRMREDFQLGEAREEYRWTVEQQRKREDTARSMANPYEISRPGNWMGAGVLVANAERNNRNLRRQQEIVDDLKARGLSQQAVDHLRLADPSNMWQTIMLANMSEDEIRRANLAFADREAISAAYQNDVDNVDERRAREDRARGKQERREDYTRQRGRAREDRQQQREWQSEDWVRNRERELEQFLINQERALLQYQKSIKRSTDALERQLERSEELLNNNLDRMNTQFSVSMTRMKEDLDDATTQMKTTTSEAIKVISKGIQAGGDDWKKYTKSAMGKVTGQTESGWEDAGGIHRRYLQQIYDWYEALANKGVGPDQVPERTAPRKRGSGGSGNEGGSGGSGSGGGSKSRRRMSGGSGGSGTGGPDSGGVHFPAMGGDAAPEIGDFPSTADRTRDKFENLLSTLAHHYQSNALRYADGDGSIDGVYSSKNMTARSNDIAAIVAQTWSQIKTIGGWRPSDPYPDHPSGQALDIMMPNEGYGQDVGLGNEIATWAMDNAKALGVKYMIWRQKIWNAEVEGPKDVEDWRGMSGRGSRTADHYDHIHLTSYPKGTVGDVEGVKPNEVKPLADKKKWSPGDSLWSLSKPNVVEMDIDEDRYGDFSGEYLKRPAWKRRGGGKSKSDGGGDWSFPLPDGSYHSSMPYGHHREGYGKGTPQDLGAAEGTRIYAPLSGQVTRLVGGDGYNGGAGNYMEIASSGGWLNRLLHMRAGSPFAQGIRQGAYVNSGQHVGYVGNTGNSQGAHLHWDIYRNGERRQPLLVMDRNNVPHKYDPPTWALAEGGVAMSKAYAMIGEAGDKEAVIPLNGRGVQVIAEALGRYAHTFEARAARTSTHSVPVASTTNIVDKSTRVTGPITVMADDPRDMLRKLEAEKRRRRLFDPVGG